MGNDLLRLGFRVFCYRSDPSLGGAGMRNLYLIGIFAGLGLIALAITGAAAGGERGSTLAAFLCAGLGSWMVAAFGVMWVRSCPKRYRREFCERLGRR